MLVYIIDNLTKRREMMRRSINLTIMFSLVIVCTQISSASPIIMDYGAEAYVYTFIDHGGTPDSDTRYVSSTNAMAKANTRSGYYNGPDDGTIYSYMETSITGSFDSLGAQIVSNIKGWENPQAGASTGNGYTSMLGTIEVGYPAGTGDLMLTVDADVIVAEIPPPYAPLYMWDWWDWSFKIWDSDPDNPLALLNDNNLTADIAVTGGQILNIQFYHEAGIQDRVSIWPEDGLSGIVTIDMMVAPEPATLLLFGLGAIMLRKK